MSKRSRGGRAATRRLPARAPLRKRACPEAGRRLRVERGEVSSSPQVWTTSHSAPRAGHCASFVAPHAERHGRSHAYPASGGAKSVRSPRRTACSNNVGSAPHEQLILLFPPLSSPGSKGGPISHIEKTWQKAIGTNVTHLNVARMESRVLYNVAEINWKTMSIMHALVGDVREPTLQDWTSLLSDEGASSPS